MISDNVQIWFCKDKNNNILTIDEVDKNKNEEYYCPICGSQLQPKQGDIMSWHFAHIDKSKCNNESIYHFWYKNKLLKPGDRFIIKADSDKEYICKEILVEETYKIEDKAYKPDLTVVCEYGELIYFEFDYTNKKKLQDYIDLWIGLGNTVVEIDVKTLMNYRKDKLPIFKALWYEGKCFNFKKGEDELYYDTIGKHKENILRKDVKEYNKEKEDLIKLDWLWKDIKRYKLGETDIEYISNLIQSIENETSRKVVVSVLKKANCQQIIKDYVEFNREKLQNLLKNKKEELEKSYVYCKIAKTPRLIYDRIYKNINVCFYTKNKIYLGTTPISDINNIDNIITSNNVKTLIEIGKSIEQINKEYKYTDCINNFDYCSFPNLQYTYSKYRNDYEIRFNGYDSIFIMSKDDVDDTFKNHIKEFIKEQDRNVFTKEELSLLNDKFGSLKNKFNNEKINIKIDIRNLYDFGIELYRKDKDTYWQVINTTRKKIKNLNEFCNSLDDLIKNEMNYANNYNYFKENIDNIVNKINNKYKKNINGNWKITLEYSNSINLYKNNEYITQIDFNRYEIIKIEDIEQEILIKISNCIRRYLYGDGGNN